MSIFHRIHNRVGITLILSRANRNNRRYQRHLNAPAMPSSIMAEPTSAYGVSKRDIISGLVVAFLTDFSIHILRVQP